MQAEIISIGTELTSGAKLDTNSQWLSLELSEIGIPVRFHSTMSDDRAPMLEVLRTAVERSDIVLVTGGLGPTLDDLTRELIAELTGTDLVLHDQSLRIIEEMFAKRGRVMPERNRIQAMFPRGSEVLANPIGTAPGIWIAVPRPGRSPCLLAAMPGVPSEMKRMYRDQVLPRLPRGSQVIRRATVHTFGQGESAVEEMLGDLTARDRNPEVGITASSATITLRIAAAGSSIEECDRMVDDARRIIRQKLGDLVYGEGSETLEEAVLKLLAQRSLTLSTVEFGGTRGLLAQQLAASPYSDQVVRGSLVVSDSAGLNTVFGSAPGDVPVSRESAALMARTCRERFQTDFALAITPFTQPSEGDVARCFLAMAHASGVEAVEHRILSDLSIARPRAVKTALDLVRRNLMT